MTKHIITAINMSWSQGDGKVDYCADLKDVKVDVTAESGETTRMDFQAFSYLIKKYATPKLPPEDREKLLAISDTDFDDKAIKSYVGDVVKTKSGSLLRTIPDTEGGREICTNLFKVLKNDPAFLEIIRSPNIDAKVSPEDLIVLANFIPNGVGFGDNKLSLVAASKDLLAERKIELESKLAAMKESIYTKVKGKLDALGDPYTVDVRDKATISAAIDAMGTDILKDNNIAQFE
ncbi:hypothetical protein BN59_02452 [Legionella massiliensis]|uniref:Uncharacterized protein n=1 Tax=Legionella massiliensis TaxID=1034943 RepID=A0A078KUL0_9GAMM|nr:hypothetical protein [Legionella massiliensis]CDZ78145.1 hypothetical protein BN59_02452 [Legionella massiliensis]CEE13883.1 hypothetical protein BN1094_02452 [Legionella massiliensis]